MMWPWDLFWHTGRIYSELFSEYPVMWMGLFGIPAGIYCYFKMYPEDWQKVKDYFAIL